MTDAILEHEAAVANASTPGERAAALNMFAEYLTETDPRRAITVAEEVEVLACNFAEPQPYISSLLNHAWAAYNMANYGLSVSKALAALKLARHHDDKSLEFDALNILGSNHQVVGSRPDALHYFIQALHLAETIGNPLQVATAHNNIGLVHEGTGAYAEALSYYLQALKVYRKRHSNSILAVIAGANVAESYNQLGQHQEAFDIAQQAIAAAQEIGFDSGKGLALMHLGNAQLGLHAYELAEQTLTQALALVQDSDTAYQKGLVLKSMANLREAQGMPEASIELFREALAVFEMLQVKPDIFLLHQHLARIYAARSDYQLAFRHMEQFHEIKEQVFNEQADGRERTLQAMYQVDKARLEAETQRLRGNKLQQEIEQNEMIIAELDSYADNVAHDLKNPISLIISFADLIQTDPTNQLSDSSRVCLDHLRDAGDKLNEIVSALLSLAKARKQSILAQSVDMNLVLEEAIKRLGSQIDRAGAILELPSALPPCQGNASWLEEAFVNYLSNAIKYGGDPPRIRVSASIEADGMISYHVQDNGAGISPEEQKKLFTRFERLGQSKIDGTGLGLMIVKTAVERLGGQVGVSSTGIPGDGTTFSMTLPDVSN
jgi:signal transduction histidine kinase